MPINEIFRHETNDISEPTTTISYSSWSNCSKLSKNHSSRKREKNIEEVLEASILPDEPVKDNHLQNCL